MIQTKRASGILMPVFSLPGPFGIGTLGSEATAFVDFLAEAKQTSGEDYSGDWGERHDEQLTDSTAQQTSGEPEAEPEAAPQAAPYTELPLDAEGYPVE